MRLPFFLLFLFAFSASIFGQKLKTKPEKAMNDPKAGKILQEVKGKIASLKSFKIEFNYTVSHGDSKTKESFAGSYAVKGKMFKLLTKNQEIYNNGTTIWTYMAANKELQISKNEGKNTITSPISMIENFDKEYYYQFKPNETPAKDQVIIELIPLDKKKPMFKIDLIIDIKKNRVVYSKLYEKSGVRQEFTINQFQENFALDDAVFTTDKTKYPKDVEVIDLR
ncbi:MAG: outer membrane lipoprotein carrier protein LolA [Chitinophagales bacterium]|nr:outer membrane lipoprotein carrier protein LolA [Chitinophagales bacterium]